MLTWNCGGNSPKNAGYIGNKNVLYDPNEEMSDIYIIGLQKMVKLNPY